MAEPLDEHDEAGLRSRLAEKRLRKVRAPWVFLLQAVVAVVLYVVVLRHLRQAQRDIAAEKRRATPPVESRPH
jgi:hypothetical protein